MNDYEKAMNIISCVIDNNRFLNYGELAEIINSKPLGIVKEVLYLVSVYGELTSKSSVRICNGDSFRKTYSNL